MKAVGTVVLIGLVALTSGCASIVSGNTQSVSITPMRDGAIDSRATCTAVNKKGQWVVGGGGAVNVRKAGDDLQVRCQSEGQEYIGNQSAPRSTQWGWAVANFFIWDLCTISCIIDFSSGAIYEYPSQVQVSLQPVAVPLRPVADPDRLNVE